MRPVVSQEEVSTISEAIVAKALEGILLIDDSGRILQANAAACREFDFTREELLSRSAQSILAPDDRPQFQMFLAQLIADGQFAGDLRFSRGNGKTRTGEIRAVANVVDGLHLLVVRDVTERKRAEDRMRTYGVLMAEAQRMAHVGSWSWDLASNRIQWSDENYRIFGMRPQEAAVTYDQFLLLVHPDDRAQIESLMTQTVRDQLPFDAYFRGLHRDGTVRHLQIRGRLALDLTNRADRIYGVTFDVTDQQRTENSLRDYAERLKQMSHRVVDIQEAERRHLAHELHDEVGQVLSAITLNLNASISSCSPANKPRIEESIKMAETAIAQLRNLSHDLRPAMLDDLGLISTLRWYADRQAERAGFRLQFNATSNGMVLSPQLEIACYRIVQEALTNVVRHAKAKNVLIYFVLRDEEAELSIQDDGLGFDLSSALQKSSKGGSFGLRGMKERIELLGGQVDIKTGPSKGTRFRAFFPINAG